MQTSPAIPQFLKATAFKMLHERNGIFIVPNAWDAGSAKMLTGLGFEALTTTSAGLAFALGKPDGEGAISQEETLANVSSICAATHLPVSADLENGYGDTPEICAETILLAAKAGLAGGSIEDATGNPQDPIYPFALAVERIRAAVKAAHSLPFPFILTARAENLIYGRPDLTDTAKRLQAFAEAGADVLFAPGLVSRTDIETIVKAIAPKPVSVVMGLGNVGFTLDELAAMGVKRVSVGSALARAAYGAFLRAAEEIRDKGSFDFSKEAIQYSKINALLRWK